MTGLSPSLLQLRVGGEATTAQPWVPAAPKGPPVALLFSSHRSSGLQPSTGFAAVLGTS